MIVKLLATKINMLHDLITYDKELFLFLNNLGTTSWDSFWLFITHKFSAIPLYILLIFLSFKQFGLKKTLILLVFTSLMIVVTNGLGDFFKYGFQRLRPCYDDEINELVRLVKDSCGGKYGYFSAHAANTMAVAIFFSNLLKKKFMTFFLIVWAMLVAYSRIYLGVHFPLDILTGMLVGLFFGWLFAKLYIFALLKLPL